MARSSYIYVVRDQVTWALIAAFTVKHEMETFRERHPNKTFYMRFRDNQPGEPVEVKE